MVTDTYQSKLIIYEMKDDLQENTKGNVGGGKSQGEDRGRGDKGREGNKIKKENKLRNDGAFSKYVELQ